MPRPVARGILVGSEGFQLARYSRSGVRDARFVEVTLPTGFAGNPISVAAQPDGRIVAAGYAAVRAAGTPTARRPNSISRSLDSTAATTPGGLGSTSSAGARAAACVAADCCASG
jgi:hypothetical protein